ncbi:MAG: phosphoribosylanthranilate isomerase [Candidatus Hydrogenedentes bacterium]|nr:phosphoribosylanthranilate isomerase [Candidatus Hydrogenedentota bacterium]
MRTRVKICGITNLEDALAACAAGADALGFNFAEEAKAKNRYIDPDEARELVRRLPPFVTTVAVCVNDSLERMHGYLEFMDYIQLHGEETPEQCGAVRGRVIKAFSLKPGLTASDLKKYPVCAYLVDAYVEGERGGTGRVCDWESARTLSDATGHLILAGGLTPENVADAVQTVGPYAVDTAGGVEREPGRKDHERLREFIHHAKISVS